MTDKTNKGFTIIELMVVVAILGILAAMFIPGLQKHNDKQPQEEVIEYTEQSE